MAKFKTALTSVLLSALALFTSQADAFEVNIISAEGEECVLEFQAGDSFQSVMDEVHACMAEPSLDKGAMQMHFSYDAGGLTIKAFDCTKAAQRDYYRAATAQEKKDVSYILKTLANNSVTKVAKEKSNLKKAGDRIEDLHPFKFLEVVFSDEELKVCIRNLEGKSWVWTEFRDGITKSLAKESAADNLKAEYISNFASTLKIDPNLIIPTINEKNWSKLLSDLIALVPRSGSSDRYNM